MFFQFVEPHKNSTKWDENSPRHFRNIQTNVFLIGSVHCNPQKAFSLKSLTTVLGFLKNLNVNFGFYNDVRGNC